MPVRRLREDGVAAFHAWLNEGAPEPAPVHLLTDPDMSEPFAPTCMVENRPFSNRYEFGVYLHQLLATAPAGKIRFDAGLWDWLSLFFIDQLAPVGADGRRRLKEKVRFALQLSRSKWSRHLVRMSWMSVQDHGDRARVLLSVPMSTHPEILEQLAGAQETFGSHTVIAAAYELYWDPAAGKTRRGAQGKGRGSPRRLAVMMRQLRRTWDPAAMHPEQILGLLPPREFGRWRSEVSTATRT